MTATELLTRAGLKYGPLNARELEKWMTSEGLAELVDGKLAPTARAVGLVDALHLERRGDGIRNARRIG